MKSDFSDVLAAVQRGESVTVAYGRKRKPIARIVPYEVTDQPRKLGILAGSARCVWRGDGRISDEALSAGQGSKRIGVAKGKLKVPDDLNVGAADVLALFQAESRPD